MVKNSYQRIYLSEISIICILSYDFLNDLDAQSAIDKINFTKKLVTLIHSNVKYALVNVYCLMEKVRLGRKKRSPEKLSSHLVL